MNEWILYVLVVRTLAYKSFSGSNFFFCSFIYFLSIFFQNDFVYTTFLLITSYSHNWLHNKQKKKLYIQQFFFLIFKYKTREFQKNFTLMMAHLIALTHTHTISNAIPINIKTKLQINEETNENLNQNLKYL